MHHPSDRQPCDPHAPGRPSGRPRLDKGTKLVRPVGLGKPTNRGVVNRREPAGWRARIYPTAGEAVISFKPSARFDTAPTWDASNGYAAEPALDDGTIDHNQLRAGRRAKAQLRRYCAANEINRLVTLTYAPPFCTDPKQLRSDLGQFFRRLRIELGQKLPYVWVPELHKDGQRFHAHVGLNRYVRKDLIAACWPHGFVDVRRIRVRHGNGAGDLAKSRQAANYLSKYVAKTFEASRPVGFHRYEVAQGFQPAEDLLVLPSEAAARAWVIAQLGGTAPSFVFNSDDLDDWTGPACRVLFFDQ